MSDRATLRYHAGLMDEMATTLGVDLQEAAIDGALRFDEISDAVLRCAQCPNPGHCAALLDQGTDLGSAPEYCRNQELLNRLAP